jgi:mono/diheme cytochrome c family protein
MKRILLAAALVTASAAALAATTRQTILDDYAREAGLAAFSAARGRAFFEATHRGGKPETPSCTTCHGINPQLAGQTRAGKAIEPMAVSVNPARFTDPAFVEKWFRRNCDTVLGRACTAAEKGDVITYLSSL